jgi:hypothetical protein
MTLEDLKSKLVPGDIGLVKSNTFLSKGIRFFENLYRKNIKKLPPIKLYSHCFTVVDIWGELYVAEALIKGLAVRPLDEVFKDYTNFSDTIILTPKKKYSAVEQDKISKEAVLSSLKITRYDFIGIVNQAILTTTGKWIGPGDGSKAERRLYCAEAVATWANKVRPKTFDRPAQTNPVDVEINKYYTLKSI